MQEILDSAKVQKECPYFPKISQEVSPFLAFWSCV